MLPREDVQKRRLIMSSVDPNRSNLEVPKGSICDNVVDFYHKLNVPASKSVGPLGGRDFVWYVSEDEQPFQVSCISSALGYGLLSVHSRISSDLSVQHVFRKST